MSLLNFSLIFIGVMLNAAAQILMKAGTNAIGHFEFSMANILPVGWKLATEWHIVTALLCYGISVVVWILALSRVPVSIAFPMLSMAYVVNAVAAKYLLGEDFNVTKLVGMGVIIIGVIIISRA
ncbi:MAG: EamA family transporter [Gammaproteobacteria bacterium]|nr:EamA family transporter [Sideroxydans sp.]MBU3903240.1 EamA family transporter [Gammaproteobacteria bacterium]MBU4045247.1 EamA family transporter [Gammaproteobacteria bacterium]MBU4151137.1 EamA family transporter [Gammaproteobacteria bacterium]